ncbi:MAG: hypothetical protein ACRDJC_23880 [Thermomicrobiales bacterium]
MDGFQVAILAMALTGTDWGPRDAHGRRRQLTAEELDALANWGWHWPGLMGVMAACATAVRWHWRPRASHRIASTRLPSRVAASQV